MGARYHPGVIWGPFLLALALGLVVSAGLYFAYLWPQVEPDEDGENTDGAAATPAAEISESHEPATGKPATESTSA